MKLKENNEITVKIKGDIKEFCANLENKGFKISKEFILDDTFFIPEDLEIDKMTEREILAKAVLGREITRKNSDRVEKILIIKKKEIDEKGNILSQEKIECDVVNMENAKRFMCEIGYKEIMRIIERDFVYEKDGFKIAIKNIENGEKLIEVETEHDNYELDNIEKLKKKLVDLEIPIYTDNFFVKKAEIELRKVLGR